MRWLYNFKEPEGQVARWMKIIGQYQFKIEHRKGSLHTNCDAMSWYPEVEGARNLDAITTRSQAGLFQKYSRRELGKLQQADPDLKVIF